MENSKEYYSELIAKYFAGETSEKEMETLFAWISQSDENRKLFNEYGKTWDVVSKAKSESDINLELEWSKIEPRIKENNSGLKMQSRSNFRLLKIAATVAIIFISSYLTYYYYLNKSNNKQYIAQNEVLDCVLPDSSKVTLNSGTIEFDEEFNIRKVNLNGEAFFDVVHNEQKPFTIETSELVVEDIGTSFYVNSKSSENKVTVILKTGKVALYNKENPSEKYFLEPGEMAEFSLKDKTFKTSLNDDNNYIAWKTKEMVFNDNSLTEILPVLNKVYRSNITIKDEETGKLKLTAEFKDQSLESVLKILKETLNLTITTSDTGIELSGNGYK